MTNPSAPETRTDAPEAMDPAAPDAAKGVSEAPAQLLAHGGMPDADNHAADKAIPVVSLAGVPPPPPPAARTPVPAPARTSTPAPPSASAAPTPTPPTSKSFSALRAARADVKIRLFGRTDVGQVREHNEDNFIVADLTKDSRGLMETDRNQAVGPRGTLLGVCDGMGGAAAGEVASQLAVDIIYQRMAIGEPPTDHDDLAARLVHAIEAAGLRIFSEAKLDRTRRGMGTTATIAALMDDHLFFGQVGDSRAYILRGDRLVQVTRDQSLVNQLIEAGQLTEEEAETFEHNNIILQALGTADTVQVDLTYVLLCRGDTLMLCSDGLSGMVRNDEIREVLRSIDDPLESCKILTDRANQAGGHDNITVVVAKFEGPDLKEPSQADIESLRYQKYQLPEPPAQSVPSIPEPSRKLAKGLDQSKISSRPPAGLWRQPSPPEEVKDSRGSEDDIHDQPISSVPVPRSHSFEDPIHIPTEGAPQWLVIMMIASAVACVTIAAYYLLR